MSPTRVFRFVNYTTRRDPGGALTWAAVCVTGESADCGAASPENADEETANRWMVEHTAQTRHQRFQRTFNDFAIVEPKA
ncbi:hypothetical protein [Streptomyces graminilatus]|uniref:DUF7848 domain-containing protein n=1 Tax=Streptomyces graminilatus TaxID=1464070 RepID=UPI00099E9C1A|nr:hypothetical protein [Streptomyces graminilatus]